MQNKVNIQSKTYLARLLAMEGVTVVYDPRMTTACFDLKRRIVTLPILEDMNNFVHDAFIGHEISHALHTPVQGYQDIQTIEGIPGVYINITEDARIERLIQRKYPGLKSDFKKFYEKFASPEYDFFEIAGKNLKGHSLIDRINLHFKVGHIIPIPFKKEEQVYVDMVSAEETWEDAVAAAKAIYAYDKKKEEEKKKKQEEREKNKQQEKEEQSSCSNQDGEPDDSESTDEDDSEENEEDQDEDSEDEESGQSEENDEEDSDDESDGEDSGQDEGDESDETGEGNGSESEDEESEDEENEDDAKGKSKQPQKSSPQEDSPEEPEDENADEDSDEALEQYAEIPEAGQTQESFDNSIKIIYQKNDGTTSFGDVVDLSNCYKDFIQEVKIDDAVIGSKSLEKSKYQAFMTSISPVINMMVAEFYLRKAAAEYGKTREYKTGKLNLDKLSQYQINPNIFLSAEEQHDVQNHGMVMFVDWSGSMRYTVFDVMKQTIVMTEFCKKMNIPFEVWGFTTRSIGGSVKPMQGVTGSYHKDRYPTFFKLFDSSIPFSKYKATIEKLFSILENGDQGTRIKHMDETPLYMCGIISKYIMQDFIRKYRTSKNSLILLTDGHPSDPVRVDDNRPTQITHIRSQTGKIYEVDVNKRSHYQKLFKIVKEELGLFKMIGFFLTNSPSTDSISDGHHDIKAGFNAKGYECLLNTNDAFDKFFMVNPTILGLETLSKNDTADIKKVSALKDKMIFMKEFVKEIS